MRILLKAKIILILLIFIGRLYGEINFVERIKKDASLIVPGLGADRVVLMEDIYDVNQRFKKSGHIVSKPDKKSELFKDIFGVKHRTKIYFETVYYFKEKKLALFVYNRKVRAIAGFNTERITADSVDLGKGIENFIFNYGNICLDQVSRESHRIYLYPLKGIAIVDDNMDDRINMYIVFPPENK